MDRLPQPERLRIERCAGLEVAQDIASAVERRFLVGFLAKLKLACWGVFTVAGTHDDSVIGRLGGKHLLFLLVFHPIRILRMLVASFWEFWAEIYDRDGIRVGRFESGPKRIFPNCSVRHQLDITGVPKGYYTALLIVDNGDHRVFGANYELQIE